MRGEPCSRALAYLVRTDRVPEAEFYQYLSQPPRYGFAGVDARSSSGIGWVRAVAMLGLPACRNRVEQILQRGDIDPRMMDSATFWEICGRPRPIRMRCRPGLGTGLARSAARSSSCSAIRRSGFSTEALYDDPAGTRPEPVAQRRTQRSLPLRQRQEIQEMLPSRLTPRRVQSALGITTTRISGPVREGNAKPGRTNWRPCSLRSRTWLPAPTSPPLDSVSEQASPSVTVTRPDGSPACSNRRVGTA